MPDIVSVNTNGASMMIGWKAGEIILGDDAGPSASTHAGTPATVDV
jgi:choline dehydrogenase-like flavoprotein